MTTEFDPEQLADRVLRHAILAERGKTGVVKRAQALLQALRREIEREIALDAVTAGFRLEGHLEGLLVKLSALISARYESLYQALLLDVRRWLVLEADYQRRELIFQGVGAAADDPPDEGFADTLLLALLAVAVLGRLPSEELAALSRSAFEQTRRVLRQAAFEQAPLQPMLIELRRAWLRRGHELDAFVKTLLDAGSTVAARRLGERYGVGYWQSIGVLDNRISRLCLYHHGKVYAVRADAPWPPRHPRCRSRVLLLGSRRRALDLPDPDKWLATKTVAERERLLGVVRARLWGRGVSLSRLLNQAGEDLGLVVLARRYGELLPARFGGTVAARSAANG